MLYIWHRIRTVKGEAIAWHISNYIKVPAKTKRIEFNEITKSAINNAIKHPRNIDENLGMPSRQEEEYWTG